MTCEQMLYVSPAERVGTYNIAFWLKPNLSRIILFIEPSKSRKMIFLFLIFPADNLVFPKL